MAYLEIETREGSRTVRLDRERLSIGRLSYNDVVLPYAQISRQHAELRCIQGQWWIADLQSTNGLQLDATRIQERALQPGDRIVLAPGVSIRFILEGQGASTGSAGNARPPSHPNTPAVPPPSARPPQPGPNGAPDAATPYRPRSVFSDDETPFFPPGRSGAQSSWPPPGTPLYPGPSAAERTPPSPGVPPIPPAHNADASSQRATLGPTPRGSYERTGESGLGSGANELFHRSDPNVADPFRRSGAHNDARTPMSSGAAKLLHVCQTCGQLTAPDSVYCQSCHNSVAHECPTCQLSLLPIQERCPRCQTINALSVRRSRPGREG